MPVAVKKKEAKERKTLAPRGKNKLRESEESVVDFPAEKVVENLQEPRRVMENKYLLDKTKNQSSYLKFVKTQIKLGIKVMPMCEELVKTTVQRFIATLVEKGDRIFESEVVSEEISNRGFEVKIL